MLFAHHTFFRDLIVRMHDLAPTSRREKVQTIAKTSKVEANKEEVAGDHITAVRAGVEDEEEDEEDEWEYQDESDVYLRSKFFESWLWKTVELPAQADRDG